MKKIIFTGGGSAGHVTPNLSLIEKLKNDYEIHYIGSVSGIEKEIISKYSFITYHPITTVKWIRKLTLKNLLIPFKLFKGINESKKIIKNLNPSIIFSKGGFVSVPVAFAGHKLKVPIIAHESDYSMGLANKLIYKKCNVMCFTFKDTFLNYKQKGVFTGTPLRQNIFTGNKNNILKNFKINLNLPTLLIFGGSLGAQAINKVVFETIDVVCKSFNVFHIVGKNNINKEINISNYHQIEFVNNIEDYFDIADIVVCRAGSNSIFELCALNKPMLLIPLPKTSSRGDQILNAKYLTNKNLSMTLYQEDLTKKSFVNSINTLYSNRNKYKLNLQKEPNFNGTNKIVELIKKYSK